MEEQNSVTFGKVMKVSFKNWVRFLIVGLSVAAVGTVALSLGYNKVKTNYVSEFSYTAADLKEGKYADGSDFNYESIVSTANLNAVQQSSEKYAKINVEKIVKNSGIKIEREIVTIENGENKISDFTYKITAAKLYMPSNEIAKDFIKDLSELPIKRDKALASSETFGASLKAAESADTYEKQISLIQAQANILDDKYNAMTEKGNITSQTSAKIANSRVEIDSLLGKRVVDEETKKDKEDRATIKQLKYAVDKDGLVKDYTASETTIEAFKFKKASLQSEKAVNSAKITALANAIAALPTGTIVSDLDKELAELAERNVEIDNEIATIDLKIANKDNTATEYVEAKQKFESNLSNVIAKMSHCVDSFVETINVAYINNSAVNYSNTNIVGQSGNFTVVASVVLSLLAGVVVGAVVNLIVDRKLLHE